MQTGLVRASQLPARGRRSTATPVLTTAAALVRETTGIITQISGTAPVSYAVWMLGAFQHASAAPVAWIAQPEQLPFPPDLTAAGLDLERLLIVRPETQAQRMTSVDRILRQELCSLTVWHLDPAQPPPPGILGRFMHLCTRTHAGLVLLVPGDALALAPAVRLHLRVMPDAVPSRLKIDVLRSRSTVESVRVDSRFSPGLC